MVDVRPPGSTRTRHALDADGTPAAFVDIRPAPFVPDAPGRTQGGGGSSRRKRLSTSPIRGCFPVFPADSRAFPRRGPVAPSVARPSLEALNAWLALPKQSDGPKSEGPEGFRRPGLGSSRFAEAPEPGVEDGGAKEDRTPDLYNAIVALSQLSYGPTILLLPFTNTGNVGALGGSRTPTAFQPLGPEPSASTSSATSACLLLRPRVSWGDAGALI